MKRPYSVGLTGGIGCGKTTVSDLFAGLGASIVDTDRIAHQLTAVGGAAIPAIRAAFGEAMITAEGALNRPLMREQVFTAAPEKQRLEAILHPMIRRASQDAAEQAQGPYVLFVIPLLVESSDWKSRFDRILVVDCPESLQITRVMQRSQLRQEQVEAIMRTQVSRATRLAAADDVIDNQGDPTELPAKIALLHANYCRLAAQKA